VSVLVCRSRRVALRDFPKAEKIAFGDIVDRSVQFVVWYSA